MSWLTRSLLASSLAAPVLFTINSCDGGGSDADESGHGGAGTAGAALGGGDNGGATGSGGTGETSSGPPAKLSLTGLYRADMTTLGDGVRAFTPRFPLYSDGAEKKRWVSLPAGTTIDTSAPDYWIFPVGAKLWKEFTRDGVRVETRLMQKRPDGTWWRVAYHWRDDQSDADAVPDGLDNASGTEHDIPSSNDCATCHGNTRGTVLGFSAFQLDNPASELTLTQLNEEGSLSATVTPQAIPGSAADVAVLGYLHANCGTCHNPTSSTQTRVNMDLRLRFDALASLTETPVYQTAVNQPISVTDGNEAPGASLRIDPGHPESSAVYLRMHSRDEVYSMPILGSEKIDEVGSGLVFDWITNLPP